MRKSYIEVRYNGGTVATTISMETNAETKKEYNRMKKLSSDEIKKELECNEDMNGFYVDYIK